MTNQILIVDDDEVARLVLAEIIKQERQWEVVECCDGKAALYLLRDGLRPAVCMVDLHMPKMNGDELVRHIRQDPILRDLEVVITSGSSDKDQIASLANLQIAGFLLKPADPRKVHSILQQSLVVCSPSFRLASQNQDAETSSSEKSVERKYAPPLSDYIREYVGVSTGERDRGHASDQ